jgi:xyloglucan-specific exo-beta-1,4-glucanase
MCPCKQTIKDVALEPIQTGPDASYPTLFVFGKISGVAGFYRSTDEGANWTLFGTFRTSRPVNQQYDSPLVVTGDWNIFGRCYLPFNSTGFAYYTQ